MKARTRALLASATMLGLLAAPVMAAVPASAAQALPAAASSGEPANPFNIWEQFGAGFAVGASQLTAGSMVIAVSHPGRTLQAFSTGGNPYFGNMPFRISSTTSGLYVATNTACTGWTLKSDPAAFGTVVTFKTEADGSKVVIARACDQNAGSHNNVAMALTSSSNSGDQWKVLAPDGGVFRALLFPGA